MQSFLKLDFRTGYGYKVVFSIAMFRNLSSLISATLDTENGEVYAYFFLFYLIKWNNLTTTI